MLFVFVIVVWIFGVTRFVRVYDFARRGRCVCRSIVRVTLFALLNFDFERSMLVLDGYTVAFGGVSVSAYTGVRVVGM